MKKYGLEKEEVAYIGDDIGDAEVMGMVGFAAAVGDAVETETVLPEVPPPSLSMGMIPYLTDHVGVKWYRAV